METMGVKPPLSLNLDTISPMKLPDLEAQQMNEGGLPGTNLPNHEVGLEVRSGGHWPSPRVEKSCYVRV